MRAKYLMICVALGVAGLSGCGPTDVQTDRLLAGQAQKSGEVVIAALEDQMFEPAATQWGAVWENLGWICGSFNPKNNIGRYVGLKRFVGSKGGVILVDGVSNQANFDAEWGRYCGHAHHLLRPGTPAGPPVHPMDKAERAAEREAFTRRPKVEPATT